MKMKTNLRYVTERFNVDIKDIYGYLQQVFPNADELYNQLLTYGMAKYTTITPTGQVTTVITMTTPKDN